MSTHALTRDEWLIRHRDRLARARALYRVTIDHLRRSDLRGVMAEERQRITDMSFSDGLYRMEFTAGEVRSRDPGSATINALDFFAEVVDGPAKGRLLGESLSFSWSRATGGANRQKALEYANKLGVDVNQLDPEEWLFRTFIAEVIDERIVSIRSEAGAPVYLPAAAEAPRELIWSPDNGWDFAPATPLRASA